MKGKLEIMVLNTIKSNYCTYPCKRTVKQFGSLRFQPVSFLKANVVGTHLNCIDLLMQFKWVPTTYAFIKKITKKKIYTQKYHISII